MEHYNKFQRLAVLAVNFIITMSAIVAFILAYFLLFEKLGIYFFLWSILAGWWFLDEDSSPFRKLWRSNKSKR